MRHLVDRAFARYGTEGFLLSAAGEQKTMVFCQSVRSRSLIKTARSFSSLGEIPNRQFVCMLPAKTMAAPQDTIRIEGISYVIRRVEALYGSKGQVLYRWCLCVEKGGADTWGMNV